MSDLLSTELDTPQLSLPFRLVAGEVVCHEQDTDEDLFQNAATVIRYTQGRRGADPSFGIPDQVLQQGGVNSGAIVSAVHRYEPDVDVTVIEAAMDEVADTGIADTEIDLEVTQNG